MKSRANKSQFSLTPGFSPVMVCRGNQNRFNGFETVRQAVETACAHPFPCTRLKPGVNKM
jgi:hypothetical protein